MVGGWRKCCPGDVPQHHKLSSRRYAHRRTVDASGERDGSLQSGAARSAVSPAATRSQACFRQGTVKCPEGANQLGKTVKVFLHGRQMPRRTQTRSRGSSWAWRSRRPWPMIVSLRQTGHSRGSRSNLPRLDVVLGVWQCDKENHGWREGPPLTVACKVSICWPGLHPPGKVRFKLKKNTARGSREHVNRDIGRL